MLELWFERRTAVAGTDGLEAVRPRAWPQEWTSELLELITLLALLAELRPRQDELAHGPQIGAEELRAAGVLPVAAAARRPASVLDHQEEGRTGSSRCCDSTATSFPLVPEAAYRLSPSWYECRRPVLGSAMLWKPRSSQKPRRSWVMYSMARSHLGPL